MENSKTKKRHIVEGLAQFKVYGTVENVLKTVETYLVHKIEHNKEPKWNVGAHTSIPHIVWSYTNSNVDAITCRKTH